MNETSRPERTPWLPPRWFIRLAWFAHRTVYRLTGGRRGLSIPTAEGKFGQMRLRTVGRKSGQERVAILGYYEDGPNLVTLAMNGWGDPEPAWWLNLQARPDAVIDVKDGVRDVHARAADGPERERLWRLFTAYKGWGGDVDAYAKRRSRPTAVVIFEPRTAPAGSPGSAGTP
jgi:deazaflavin-dependent oxidoreductase (nitroreductase family)